MNAHQWFIEHRMEFAIRALDATEHDTFVEHLSRCEECQREVKAIEHDLQWLPMGAEAGVTSPGQTRRIAASVLERPTGSQRWIGRTAAAAAAVALLATGGGWWRASRNVSALRSEVDALRASLRGRDVAMAAILDTLSVIRDARRVVHAALPIAGTRGSLVIFEDPASHRWTVVVHGLPNAPAGERYSLWFVCDRGMRQGVELPANQAGPAVLVVPMPQDLGTIRAASITQETTEMSNGMPVSKKEILHLTM